MFFLNIINRLCHVLATLTKAEDTSVIKDGIVRSHTSVIKDGIVRSACTCSV